MAGRLEGKVAVITGGASGFGEATGRLFAQHGARVVLCDIQDDRGERVAKELGDAAVYQRTDVREEAQVAAAVDRALSHFGHLDCMFANAGIVGSVGPIESTLVEEWEIPSPNLDIVDLDTTYTVSPTIDSWYVVIAPLK